MDGRVRSGRPRPAGRPVSVESLLEERGAVYGDFRLLAVTAQDIKTALHNGPRWRSLLPAEQEALEMMATKMARAVCGRGHRDNYDDIAGYAKLAADILP